MAGEIPLPRSVSLRIYLLNITGINLSESCKKSNCTCKAKQPRRGMELQEKEAQKRFKHTGNLFRKNLQLQEVS